MVYAEGSPDADAYTNKEGVAAATLRMRVLNLQLLGGNTDNPTANVGNVTNAGYTQTPVVRSEVPSASMSIDDDLPF